MGVKPVRVMPILRRASQCGAAPTRGGYLRLILYFLVAGIVASSCQPKRPSADPSSSVLGTWRIESWSAPGVGALSQEDGDRFIGKEIHLTATEATVDGVKCRMKSLSFTDVSVKDEAPAHVHIEGTGEVRVLNEAIRRCTGSAAPATVREFELPCAPEAFPSSLMVLPERLLGGFEGGFFCFRRISP